MVQDVVMYGQPGAIRAKCQQPCPRNRLASPDNSLVVPVHKRMVVGREIEREELAQHGIGYRAGHSRAVPITGGPHESWTFRRWFSPLQSLDQVGAGY